MRNVKWARKARTELLKAVDFISDGSPQAAIAVHNNIYKTAQKLGQRPIGRPSRMSGYFEKSVLKTQYILVYTLTESEVHIIRLMHSAQNWTTNHWPDN